MSSINKAKKIVKTPQWTVFANIPGEWTGTIWMFFDLASEAEAAYLDMNGKGYCPMMRKWHKDDITHMGANDAFWLSKDLENQ